MSSRLWKFLVQDIVDAIARIPVYVYDLDFGEFQQDRKTLDAVAAGTPVRSFAFTAKSQFKASNERHGGRSH